MAKSIRNCRVRSFIRSMANVSVRLVQTASSAVAEADTLDTPGGVNRWKSRTGGAWSVDGGDFINSLNGGKGQAGGEGHPLYLWELDRFDIDDVQVGDTGTGINGSGNGFFPPGDIT